MSVAGTKQSASNRRFSTPSTSSKRRKPLSIVTGNTVSQPSVTQHQVQQHKPLPSQGADFVPPSSPSEIRQLWNEVKKANGTVASKAPPPRRMAPKRALRATASDNGRESVKDGAAESDKRALAESAADDTEDHTTVTSKSRTVGPQSAHFRTSVLALRGIMLCDRKDKSRPPQVHFSTDLPFNGDYAADARFSHASVWLSLDNSRREAISKHYSFMEKMRLSEDQFATYAKQNFFVSEEWELNCFVYRGWISNPYFTIEFKKNDWKTGVAATQLLSAASIALYNRCELRAQAKRTKDETDDLRHYGMTFEGSQFVVYTVEPKALPSTSPVPTHVRQQIPQLVAAEAESSKVLDEFSFAWHGCEMRRLAQGDCTNPRDVERLQRWVNGIHRWGITVHAQGVQQDIKIALADDGIDVSALEIMTKE